MLEQLKRLNVDNTGLEELIALRAFAGGFRDTAESVGYEAEWIGAQIKVVDREIRSRLADTVEKELAAAKAQLAALTPAEEKRKALADKIAALSAKLGVS